MVIDDGSAHWCRDSACRGGVVAFFGYHLQGRDDYAEYFSEEFVAQHDDLAWGVRQANDA